MSPVEVWVRLNHARHNAAKERVHFLSSIECALLYAVDTGLLSANNPNLVQVNKVGHIDLINISIFHQLNIADASIHVRRGTQERAACIS